jgi:vesicle-fusing ATPase
LQALLTLVKKKPPNPERKLFIVGTTSQEDILESLEIVSCFNVRREIPAVSTADQVVSILNNFKCAQTEVQQIAQNYHYPRTPIKKLLLAVELA